MRRWVITLLLFVLPFQLAWGSAAPYCAHEAGVSAMKHFGHHEHKHQVGNEIVLAFDEAGDADGAFHSDCSSCHIGCAAFMLVASPAVEDLPEGGTAGNPGIFFDSHIPAAPLRPDRAHANPAARFGGDVVVVSLAD